MEQNKKIRYQKQETGEWVIEDVFTGTAVPGTICYYTGTEDAKGTPIFEGDTLEDMDQPDLKIHKLWNVSLKDGSFTAEARKFAHTNDVILLPKRMIVNKSNVSKYQLTVVGTVFDKK